MEDEQRQEEEKAAGYAAQPDRFRLLSLILEMRSEHGTRIVSYQFPIWSCTCNHAQDFQGCSHVLAAKMLYFQKVRKKEDTADEPL